MYMSGAKVSIIQVFCSHVLNATLPCEVWNADINHEEISFMHLNMRSIIDLHFVKQSQPLVS